jgi:hypothetical protein
MSPSDEERLMAKLRDANNTDAPVDDDSELCYDLSIFGWDLWELLDWVAAEFKVDFNDMDVSKYSPSEGGFMNLHTLFGGKRKYRSLTVADLKAAIARGRWMQS